MKSNTNLFIFKIIFSQPYRKIMDRAQARRKKEHGTYTCGQTEGRGPDGKGTNKCQVTENLETENLETLFRDNR